MPLRLAIVLLLPAFSEIARGQDTAALPKVGDQAPEIVLETLLQAPKGSVAKLEGLKGKVVILEFWATWCGPCVGAIPHLNEIAEKYADKPIQFISITDEKEALIRKFIKKKMMKGWVGLDLDGSVFKAYGIRGRPTCVLIDKGGKLLAFTRPDSLTEKTLDELLAGKPLSLGELDSRRRRLTGKESDADLLPALYEVSIRPTNTKFGATSSGPGNVHLRGFSLQSAVARAFGVRGTRVLDRASETDDKYDIVVSVPGASGEMLMLRLREALELAFGIRVRKEEQEMEVYLLTVSARGVTEGLQRTVSTGGSFTSNKPDRVTGVNQPLESLAHSLEWMLGRPVLDRTGLDGHFDWSLKFEKPNEKFLQAALREQLGLELTPAKAPVEMLIIEKTREAEDASE